MQFYDLCPKVARWLIGLATNRLQDSVKERYQEEWMSHLQECNGKLGALFHGFGCLWASFAMQMDFSKFVVQTKAYIFVLFVEWLVRLRIENSARKIIAAEKSGVDKIESDQTFEAMIDDMAKIVLFGMYRQQIFRLEPDNAALNKIIKPFLALPKWQSKKP